MFLRPFPLFTIINGPFAFSLHCVIVCYDVWVVGPVVASKNTPFGGVYSCVDTVSESVVMCMCAHGLVFPCCWSLLLVTVQLPTRLKQERFIFNPAL